MVYMIVKVPLRPVFKAILPRAVYERFQVSIFGWEFLDKYSLHEKIGPSFILVTPAMNELWCADPAMAQIVLARRKDFVQSDIAAQIIGFLGQNILTVSPASA